MVVVVGQGDQKKEYKLHKNILAMRSTYFRQAFLGQKTQQESIENAGMQADSDPQTTMDTSIKPTGGGTEKGDNNPTSLWVTNTQQQPAPNEQDSSLSTGSTSLGSNNIIELPQLLPADFEVLLKRLYGGEFVLETILTGPSSFVGVYESTKILGTPLLRHAIHEAAQDYALKAGTIYQQPPGVRNPYILLEVMCHSSDASDWDALLKVMEALRPRLWSDDYFKKNLAMSSYSWCYLLSLAVVCRGRP